MIEKRKEIMENLKNFRREELRYGENWDQSAYLLLPDEPFFEQLHGKKLSLTNSLDIYEAALLMYDFENSKKWLRKYGEKRDTAVGILKHTSPSGFSLGETVGEAYEEAVETDRLSCYGGAVVSNKPIDETFIETRKKLKEEKKYPFIEVLVAPEYEDNSLNKLKDETKDLRIIRVDFDILDETLREGYQFVSVGNVVMVYEPDIRLWNDELLRKGKIWEVPTKRKPTDSESADGIIAWFLVKRGYSNSSALVKNGQLLGFCGGQPSRVDSAKFAAWRAEERGHDTSGSVSATDSFFPFPDGVEAFYKSGATANVNPGGGVREKEIIDKADELGVTLMFTKKRVFRHLL